jgi:threonine dehydrogenase-like Zn-dependent dehydrogenase
MPLWRSSRRRDSNRLAEAALAALRRVVGGRLSVTPMLTHHFPLDRIDEAYQALDSKPYEFGNAVVTL